MRKEEDTTGTKESEDVLLTEGQTTFNSSFIKSVSTEIVIDRKFTIPGYIYNLTLISYNMHDITAPNIIMRWHIECQNPVVPEDWSLLYHPNIHFGQMFEITLQVEPEKALPTRPTISVYAVKGFPGSGEGEWAMRRWDHAPFYAMLKPDYIVPFYVKDDKSDEAKRVLAPGSAHWGPGPGPSLSPDSGPGLGLPVACLLCLGPNLAGCNQAIIISVGAHEKVLRMSRGLFSIFSQGQPHFAIRIVYDCVNIWVITITSKILMIRNSSDVEVTTG